MVLKIVDYNRGQLPDSIKEAIDKSGYSRKDIEEYLETNEILKVIHDGFYYGIAKQ